MVEKAEPTQPALTRFQADFAAYKLTLEQDRPETWTGYFRHLWCYLPDEVFPGGSEFSSEMKSLEEIGQPAWETTANSDSGFSELRKQQTNRAFYLDVQQAITECGLDLKKINALSKAIDEAREQSEPRDWYNAIGNLYTYVMPAIEKLIAKGYSHLDF